MSFDDLTALYQDNETVVSGLALLALVGLLLLLTANRMRKMTSHRATLLVANLLTVVAAGLATAVSASGMWKFFTDILGDSPLRYAFFWFIEIALFASSLLARARLLRDPANASTGVDGAAVWVFASLTASLSALDASSFREVCLRLAAPLVAAWMWERALAAERSARTGTTTRRIHWTLTLERVFVWLRLAEAQGRDVTEIDRVRRRARLGRARLDLYLLQGKKTSVRRLRRAHNKVIRRAMQAAEHAGLADIPDASTEREAIQMYMATIYGIVDATSPEAVAHLNAWHTTQSAPIQEATEIAHDNPGTTLTPAEPVIALLPQRVNGHAVPASDATGTDLGDEDERETALTTAVANDAKADTAGSTRDGDTDRGPDDELTEDDELEDEDAAQDDDADVSAVTAMRRFWEAEVAQGRVPTGAELSRAAGVPPRTGLGRRKRRAWESELADHLRRPFTHAADR
ncbi:hypothetical protein F4553_005336 [Allocatelliglobosispora scoriae]|uniref:DUF2637 domain-containing protein n=1 Tax=Allocatelliglobosispora scoriae TaxID=643052 RepID=A0A841BSC1_9ACTN|nr:hypothetical protein [Allocatelliglobosispora scoriae]MBB5871957.1 hypothetical protein [Allocatelliglobosispora scoriae]